MDWADKWFITFNPQKTESLTFTRKRNPNIPHIMMAGVKVKEVEEHKHLGLILQKDGRWSAQIKDCISKTKRRVDILRGLSTVT